MHALLTSITGMLVDSAQKANKLYICTNGDMYVIVINSSENE
jgi:hypothetical protein